MNEIEMRLAKAEHALHLLEERRAIEDVLSRYSRALDWLDDTLLADVFFDDAAIDYGFFKGTGAEFRPVVMEIERAAGRRWHFTAQVSIDLTGDSAFVNSYNLSMAAAATGSSPPSELNTFYGYYVDRFERRDGVWNIAARRHLLLAGTAQMETEMAGPLASLNAIGATGPEHPNYRRMA